jgi:hypothetical protein
MQNYKVVNFSQEIEEKDGLYLNWKTCYFNLIQS